MNGVVGGQTFLGEVFLDVRHFEFISPDVLIAPFSVRRRAIGGTLALLANVVHNNKSHEQALLSLIKYGVFVRSLNCQVAIQLNRKSAVMGSVEGDNYPSI